MATNVKIIDGGVHQGSRQLTIAVGVTNASTVDTVYATDDFSWDVGSSHDNRTDENNIPNGRTVVKGDTVGSATLQLATLTTPLPYFGNLFTEDIYDVASTFYVTEVGRRETKAGITTVPIKFMLALTTSVTVTDSDGVITTAPSVTIP